MTSRFNASGLTEVEPRRIVIAESLAIWYPDEEAAGYNGPANFHLASERDAAYIRGLDQIKRAGSKGFGIAVDERVAHWATPDRIASLGLSDQSCETIWGRRIDFGLMTGKIETPGGFRFGPSDMPEDELARLINLGWNLAANDARGNLFSRATRIPGWNVFLARDSDAVGGVSILCAYEDAGIPMLAVVMPEYRGRGLQVFFIDTRLAEAATRLCTLEISETDEENSSPRNLQRAGIEFCFQRQLYSCSLGSNR